MAHAQQATDMDAGARKERIAQVADRVAARTAAEEGKELSPDELASVAEKAEKLVKRMENGDASELSGLEDFQKLGQAMGTAVPRVLTEHYIEHSGLGAAQQEVLKKQAAAVFSALPDGGAIELKIREGGQNVTAYLLLDECPADHDLGAELDKLYSRIPASRHEEVKKHLSFLVFVGRQMYTKVIMDNESLYRPLSDRFKFDIRQLGIDPTNTTLFGGPEWPKRVGIFVKFANSAQ
jgi:hypothetical protein